MNRKELRKSFSFYVVFCEIKRKNPAVNLGID